MCGIMNGDNAVRYSYRGGDGFSDRIYGQGDNAVGWDVIDEETSGSVRD